tara:strand:+ start:2047 stop:2433 length:387 start_codon:yes stop_codon:yes gene_type:complete
MLGACLSSLLISPWVLGQDLNPTRPQQTRVGEIHEACQRAGISVRTVRQKRDGTYEIDCPEGDHARACQIMEQVLATPAPGQTPVSTLQDALVVIRFEPRNRKANELLRKRYDELRQAHLEQLKRDGK